MSDLSALAGLSPEDAAGLAEFTKDQGTQDPKQLPGRPQVWKVGHQSYLVYYIPGSNVPMVWEATQEELTEKFAGADATEPPSVDKEMSPEEFQKLSPWLAGRINEIRLTAEDPWTQFFSDYTEAAELRPWLRDPDMLATIATSYLEGREPTADELSQTDWWNNHTAAERKWLETSVTMGRDEVNRQRNDMKRKVTNRMLELGLKDVDSSIIGLIAVRLLTGFWSEDKANEQIRKLADPFSVGTLDPEVASRVKDKMRRTRVEEDTVRDLATEWLGPQMGSMTQEEIERWAGRFRNNPDARVDFEDHLRQQRMALFPTYTNPNLTYENIVAPFRNLAENVWNQPVRDETMLVDLANLGDFSEAQKRLRKSGLDQGVAKVVEDALSDLGQEAIGERVVRSTI